MAWTAKKSNTLARQNIDTLTALEKDRLKPNIVVEAYSDIPFYCIRVSNYGQTSAHNIRFKFTPDLTMLEGGENAFPKEKRTRPIGFIDTGIHCLAPKASISAIIGTFQRIQEYCPELVYRGTITYNDESGKPYTDTAVVDISLFNNILHVDRKTVHHVAKQLEDIKRSIDLIATGFHKPHILVQDVKEYRAEEEEFIRKSIEQNQQPIDSPPTKKASNRRRRRRHSDPRYVQQADGKIVASAPEGQ